ncbi:MAG: hypothetical protein NT094_03150, partial [Candidatus Staskawiczbacteria bacterium]|nr:hypothetical protein [Candidatus Staskawiczbacteria bacterium]
LMFMMERYYPEKTMQEKKQLFYDLLRYWYGLISKLKPEAVIFEEIPHHLHSHVAYSVLKFLKKKTVIVNSTNIKDRIFLTLDNKFYSPELNLAIKKNSNKNFNFEGLPSEIKSNLELKTCLREEPMKSLYHYHERKIKSKYGTSFFVGKLIIWLKIIFSRRILGIALKYIKNRIYGNAKKEYLDVQKKPDFNSKYIYAPLHFQPEASTTVLGGIFANQINFVEILSASLPEEWKIYIKEHPVQFYNNGVSYSAFRFKGYYERISKIKGVEIIPLETSTYELMENAQVTATITGTAAWESLMRLKPALIFGDNWFQECPGLFKIKNVAECKRALDLISSGEFKIGKEDIVRFLFSFAEVAVRGNFYFFSKKESNVDEETNINNLYGCIVKAIV